MNAVVEREGACWRCDSRVGLAPACGTCHAPQPVAADVDHYDILGIERSLAVDLSALERRYHDLARSVHPDRHQVGTARSTELSVQATAALNRAYRTLREPIARGRYWLELHGRSLAEDNNRVPPALATLVFDVHEQLEELRAAPHAAGVRAGVETARAELKERLATEIADLEGCYAHWGGATDAAALDVLKRRLTEVSYLKTLLGDVEGALGE
jgi:molecular chaperone HscB